MRYIKKYRIFESNISQYRNTKRYDDLIDSLVYIFDKYNIPENVSDNMFSWYLHGLILTICCIPNRELLASILEDILKEKKTIEKRTGKDVEIHSGFDEMGKFGSVGGYIEIRFKNDTPYTYKPLSNYMY